MESLNQLDEEPRVIIHLHVFIKSKDFVKIFDPIQREEFVSMVLNYPKDKVETKTRQILQ